MCSKEGESPTDKEELDVNLVEGDIPGPTLKEKKKKKHRGEKRKRSCSTESTSSASSSKKHKKKKKKKNKDNPPSPKVNPIFLWVKQDHTKIVEVLCEDYDKRNRIKLTKTPGGWVAIPRTNRFCPETPNETKIEEPEPKKEPEEVKPPKVEEGDNVQEVKLEVAVAEIEEVRKDPECTEIKCCPEENLDENHNNEVEAAEDCVDLCRNLEDDVEEVKVPEDTPDDEPIEIPDDEEGIIHQDNCVNLMNELADMCFVENLKEEVEDKDLDDIYTFVPSPVEAKEDVKTYSPVKETKKSATPEPSPMNLVVHHERESPAEEDKEMKLEPLKQSDLENLDILWRLPEGTTISHSKPLGDTKPTTPTLKLAPTFTQPVQEEPLNLGKPKPKEEKKIVKPSEDSKLMELLRSDEKIQSNPLDQLKEVLSDPELSVPDPLLVPRARLPALIANPAKEIPKLLAQHREVKYPKLDPDLMVVSLAHLQSILQKSGKEDDLKIYQQQMMSGYEKMDPATAALNQMLWLPYLSQLEAKHNQELMAMLYPHYMYPQHYPSPSPTSRYPYPRAPWPRAETSKPKQPVPPKHNEQPKHHLHELPKHHHQEQPKHHHNEQPKHHHHHEQPKQQQQQHDHKHPEAQHQPKPVPKPKLKVRDNLVEPNQRTNLLKFDPTAPFLPSVGVPPNSNLWHPLFSSPDGQYTSRWNWTTPVTVSGE